MHSSLLAIVARREEAYKSELAAVKGDLVKTSDERANLRWSVKNLVVMVQEDSADLDGAL